MALAQLFIPPNKYDSFRKFLKENDFAFIESFPGKPGVSTRFEYRKNNRRVTFYYLEGQRSQVLSSPKNIKEIAKAMEIEFEYSTTLREWRTHNKDRSVFYIVEIEYGQISFQVESNHSEYPDSLVAVPLESYVNKEANDFQQKIDEVYTKEVSSDIQVVAGLIFEKEKDEIASAGPAPSSAPSPSGIAGGSSDGRTLKEAPKPKKTASSAKQKTTNTIKRDTAKKVSGPHPQEGLIITQVPFKHRWKYIPILGKVLFLLPASYLTFRELEDIYYWVLYRNEPDVFFFTYFYISLVIRPFVIWIWYWLVAAFNVKRFKSKRKK